jgi:BA14K-like protein
MKRAIMLAGFAALLASPVLAQAPSGSYGSGNIIFPGDPAAAAAAGAYATTSPGIAGGAYAYEPAPVRGGDCAQRFKSYDPRSGTYLSHDGRRHICR